ncbi:hypothetical protein D3C84_817480 [compost metagenome]
MQTKFTTGQLWQVVAFLRLTAVTQQGEHVVHLPVNSAGVTTAAIHFFENYRGFGQPQTRPAIFRRDHRSQPACVGQRFDEGFREAFFFVDFAPVSGIEFGAQGAHAFADGMQFFVIVRVHY